MGVSLEANLFPIMAIWLSAYSVLVQAAVHTPTARCNVFVNLICFVCRNQTDRGQTDSGVYVYLMTWWSMLGR